MGAPNGLYFPHAMYNMAATRCLKDISDTPHPKTNERLNEVRRLLRIALEKQAESSASRCHATLSWPSQMMATPNGDHSDAHAPHAGGSSGNTFGNSFDRPQT